MILQRFDKGMVRPRARTPEGSGQVWGGSAEGSGKVSGGSAEGSGKGSGGAMDVILMVLGESADGIWKALGGSAEGMENYKKSLNRADYGPYNDSVGPIHDPAYFRQRPGKEL